MELSSQIEMHASPAKVWKLLTDFPNFPQWNPFIRSIAGKLQVGERLVVNIQPSGARGMQFNPVVLKLESQQELRWLGHLIIPGLFDGEHIFEIEPLKAGNVRFHQREVFSGILVPLVMRFLAADTLRGFNEMNQKLKEMAESM